MCETPCEHVGVHARRVALSKVGVLHQQILRADVNAGVHNQMLDKLAAEL